MASWADFEAQEPEFAARARSLFEAHKHLTLATLRADGAPRISGTEMPIREGEAWLGSMLDARKARDLRRDGRCAVHSGSDDPPEWKGDAKLYARAIEIIDQDEVTRINGPEHAGRSHLFRLELELVSVVALNAGEDAIVVESWKPGASVSRIERD